MKRSVNVFGPYRSFICTRSQDKSYGLLHARHQSATIAVSLRDSLSSVISDVLLNIVLAFSPVPDPMINFQT